LPLISIDDTRIYFDDVGRGETLVFLHAGLGDRRMFANQLAHFQDRYRVIAIDMRGFGESLRTAAPYKASADVIAVLDACRIDSAHLIGVSMSSRIAAEVALEYLDRTQSLILVATMMGTTPSAWMYSIWTEITALLEQGEIDEANERLIQMWIDGPNRKPDEVEPTFRAQASQMNRELLTRSDTAETEVPVEPPASERLADLRVPLAIIWGTADIAEVLDAGRTLTVQFPQAFSRAIAGAGHLPQMERPAEFNAALDAFLGSIDQMG
jgi:pimeloyl-ACP methyl ester carboxylesterase